MQRHELRDYQTQAIQNVRGKLKAGLKRVILQMPTGSGKTATAAAVIESALGKGRRVIFTVPAISLITQTIESFRRDGIIDIGVMQGQHELTDADQPVQICSVQTLARRQIPEADLVVVDEAHIVFDLYSRWFNHDDWKDTPIIGLSATPWTKGLAKLWDDLVIGATTQDMIDKGHLCSFRVFAPSTPDLSGIKTVAGDYDLGGLDKAMNKTAIIADIVQTWIERGENRPTLCFCVNRAHAANVCDAFNRAGISAAYVDGETPLDERDDLAQDFKKGVYKIICNVGVMTTGVDLPFVSCLILARPTKSEMLFVQIIGRGLRPAEGKTDCLILDHSDTTARLGFVTDIHHEHLDDGTKKQGGGEKEEKKEALPKPCPSCTYLIPPKLKVCPSCGFEIKPKANVRTVDGQLVEYLGDGRSKFAFENNPEMWEKETFYRELLGLAQERGYKRGWAFHQYREKYKENPDRNFSTDPVKTSDQTRSWLKHVWIKRKKAKDKVMGGWR